MSKPTTPASLKKELARLVVRREQLASELTVAEQAHGEAQERLLQADPGVATGTVAVHYSAVSSLREAIATIDERVSSLQQDLTAAEAYSAKADERAKIAELEQQATTAEAAFCRLRLEAARSLKALLVPANEAYLVYASAMRELASLRGTRLSMQIDLESLGVYQPIDLVLQNLLDASRRPSREERQARASEISRREQEARERNDASSNKHLKRAAIGLGQGWNPGPEKAA